MLEKCIPAKGCNEIHAHLYFMVKVLLLLLLLLLRATAAAHNTSTEEERGTTFSFLVAALNLLFNHREGGAEKGKIGFWFLFDTGTQPIAFSVTGYVLLFLTTPSSCLQLKQREGYWLLFPPSQSPLLPLLFPLCLLYCCCCS